MSRTPGMRLVVRQRSNIDVLFTEAQPRPASSDGAQSGEGGLRNRSGRPVASVSVVTDERREERRGQRLSLSSRGSLVDGNTVAFRDEKQP